jgi:malate synthase
VTPALIRTIEDEELVKVREAIGAESFSRGRFNEAREIFELAALGEEFVEFLTFPAYERID